MFVPGVNPSDSETSQIWWEDAALTLIFLVNNKSGTSRIWSSSVQSVINNQQLFVSIDRQIKDLCIEGTPVSCTVRGNGSTWSKLFITGKEQSSLGRKTIKVSKSLKGTEDFLLFFFSVELAVWLCFRLTVEV